MFKDCPLFDKGTAEKLSGTVGPDFVINDDDEGQ